MAKMEKLTLAERMGACRSQLTRVLNSNTNSAFIAESKDAPNMSEHVSRYPYRPPFGGEDMMQHRKQARRGRAWRRAAPAAAPTAPPPPARAPVATRARPACAGRRDDQIRGEGALPPRRAEGLPRGLVADLVGRQEGGHVSDAGVAVCVRMGPAGACVVWAMGCGWFDIYCICRRVELALPLALPPSPVPGRRTRKQSD